MPKLTTDELNTVLADNPGWRLEGTALVRDWKFEDFAHAIAFVNRVAALAEKADHHPDIDIRYNGVKLALVSHDVGGITDRDARMVKRLADEP